MQRAPRTIIAFHGTNQSFDRFEARFLGSANPNTASRAAFFFSRGRQAASDYARHAARTMIPEQEAHEAEVERLLAQADLAMRRGQNDRYEALIQELEEFEGAALNAPPSGAVVLECRLRLSNPAVVRAQDVMRDLASVLERARAAGHDAVVIRGICDTPSGTGGPDDHIAVFDAENIEIVAHHIPDPEPDLVKSGCDGAELEF